MCPFREAVPETVKDPLRVQSVVGVVPDVPDVPEVPDVPVVPEVPDVPDVPLALKIPKNSCSSSAKFEVPVPFEST